MVKGRAEQREELRERTVKRAMGSILRRWADPARSRMRVAAVVAILGASPPVFANGSDDAHEYRLAPGDR